MNQTTSWDPDSYSKTARFVADLGEPLLQLLDPKPGEVIWRLEVWRFEKPDDAWIKVQDELFLVLYRQRLQKADFDKKTLTLDPALGGIKLTEKKTSIELGKVSLPGKEAGIKLRPVK